MSEQFEIRIDGLAELRRAIRTADGRAPRELTAGLKRAAEPILSRLRGIPARRTGDLAGSYKASVRGTSANIVTGVPYGAGAEWGRYGRWRGFERYGAVPRFVWPAVEAEAKVVMGLIAEELEELLTIRGWAR